MTGRRSGRLVAINQKDDVDATVKWMLDGRMYAEGFERCLPNTCKDLRSGKVTPETVADELDAIHKDRKCNYMGMGGMGIDQDAVFFHWHGSWSVCYLRLLNFSFLLDSDWSIGKFIFVLREI